MDKARARVGRGRPLRHRRTRRRALGPLRRPLATIRRVHRSVTPLRSFTPRIHTSPITPLHSHPPVHTSLRVALGPLRRPLASVCRVHRSVTPLRSFTPRIHTLPITPVNSHPPVNTSRRVALGLLRRPLPSVRRVHWSVHPAFIHTHTPPFTPTDALTHQCKGPFARCVHTPPLTLLCPHPPVHTPSCTPTRSHPSLTNIWHAQDSPCSPLFPHPSIHTPLPMHTFRHAQDATVRARAMEADLLPLYLLNHTSVLFFTLLY